MSREVVTQLEERGCSVVRVWAGHLVTSLGAPICEAMRIVPASASINKAN